MADTKTGLEAAFQVANRSHSNILVMTSFGDYNKSTAACGTILRAEGLSGAKECLSKEACKRQDVDWDIQ